MNPLTPVPNRTLRSSNDAEVPLPDPTRLTHLQFRRFAGCPICNLHLRSIIDRHAEILAADIQEVVVFHSSAAELRNYTTELPLDFIADPQRELYREFGVTTGAKSLLNPRAVAAIARSIGPEIQANRRGERPAPPTNPEGGRLGLPADFLIAPDGQVLAAKYGTHADDQWSVDELLAHAAQHR